MTGYQPTADGTACRRSTSTSPQKVVVPIKKRAHRPKAQVIKKGEKHNAGVRSKSLTDFLERYMQKKAGATSRRTGRERTGLKAIGGGK